MTARDLFLIGGPALLGGALLSAFLLRAWKGNPVSRFLRAYGSTHERLTERLVSKRILRFPGACLVSSIRHWAFAELFGVEALGERSRPDDVAEHHRELPAFGIRGNGSRKEGQSHHGCGPAGPG